MEEVNSMTGMVQEYSKEEKGQDDSNLTMEELEKKMGSELQTIRNGSIVTGTVIDITPSEIYVNLGYKSDGVLSSEEWDDETRVMKKGDKIRVFIKRVDDGRGQLILSRKQAKERDAWDHIQNSHSQKTPVDGVIRERIKGGYDVSIQGIRAFLPQSQLSHGKNVKESIGKTYPMLITECDRRRRNIVVSEKALVEESKSKRRQEIITKYKENDLIKGVVSRIVEYGAFVDLGDGVEGLIHRNDLSWSVINNPREVVKPGDPIEARILKIDQEKGKIGLGLKQRKEDPWLTVDQRYEVNQKYNGTVKNLMDFGAFVELEEGIEGLVHISDLAWKRDIQHPRDIVETGKQIPVVVKEIDKEKKRISLSYKATQPHPWDSIGTRFHVDDIVSGKVKNTLDYGAFIDLGNGIEGLIHISDMDWNRKITHPKEILEKGQEVKVKILNIDSKSHRISLGLKQTMADPWELVEQTYHVGDTVTGVVKNLVNYGAFVQLQNGLEGLLHISEFSWQSEVKNPGDVLKIGDQITVAIYEVDKAKQKISLSLKRLSEDPWKGIERRFPVGSIQTGKVLLVENTLVEVELGTGISGSVHISQLSQTRVSHPSEVTKVGDTVTTKILEIDRKNRKFKLSMKEAVIDNETRELKKYQDESSHGFSDTIGDILKDQLASFKEHLKG
ncbi:S1 RNA-binding domain-containing protein [bacterium]|nr:S1 RNA-binding domain-containing protein [bacterium]